MNERRIHKTIIVESIALNGDQVITPMDAFLTNPRCIAAVQLHDDPSLRWTVTFMCVERDGVEWLDAHIQWYDYPPALPTYSITNDGER